MSTPPPRTRRRPRRLLARPFRHCSVPPATAGHCSHKSVCFCDAAPAYQRAPVTDAAASPPAQGGCGSHSPNGKDGRGCIGPQVSPRISRPPSVRMFVSLALGMHNLHSSSEPLVKVAFLRLDRETNYRLASYPDVEHSTFRYWVK